MEPDFLSGNPSGAGTHASCSAADRIDHLFNPGNVVLVGASERPGHWSRRVWDNLRKFGFSGAIHLVNPNSTMIWGHPSYKSIRELPETPDHLAIFTPATTIFDLLKTGATAGARSATIYASGFDAAGQPKMADLAALIVDTGLAVVGPNCMGAAGGKRGFSTIPDETLGLISEGSVAVIAQSGSMCTSINRALNEQQIAAAYLVSCGNQASLNFGHFIEYFSCQDALRVILCYIESIPDPEHFLKAAIEARRRGKIVVAVKIGGSDASRKAALAHTGALAGNLKVFEAYASAAGVIVLASLEDAIEAAEFLCRATLPQTPGVAIVTISGALRSLITEAASQMDLRPAPLASETILRLRETLHQDDIANPLDTKLTLPTSAYVACINCFLDDPQVGLVLLAEEFPKDESVRRRVENWAALDGMATRAQSVGKAVGIFTPLLGGMTEFDKRLRAQIPCVPVMRETVKTLRVVKTLMNECGRPPRSMPIYQAPAQTALLAEVRKLAHSSDVPITLNESDSKRLMREYGIPICPEKLVRTLDEAVIAATTLGYPVVLKAVSGSVAHKSDLGLVKLNIRNAMELENAFHDINNNATRARIVSEGYLVAKQLSEGIETVLGAHLDREMGACVMFGLGGVFVELFEDVAFAPALLDQNDAWSMVQATRASKLLKGLRGTPPADVAALTDAIVRLGRLASDLSDVIDAVDINPFLVCESGAFALDGLIVVRPAKR